MPPQRSWSGHGLIRERTQLVDLGRANGSTAQPAPNKSSRIPRLVLVGVAVLVVVAGSMTLQLMKSNAAVKSRVPSARIVDSWCRSLTLPNGLPKGVAGPLRPVALARLGPVGDARQGQSLVVLEDGPTGAGFYCLLGDSGGEGLAGEIWTPRRGSTFAVLPLFAASNKTMGTYGVVAKGVPGVSAFTAVTGGGHTVTVRPIDGLAAFFIVGSLPGAHNGPLGELVGFDSRGRVIGTGDLP
jgi:hypothetical protein